MFKAVSRNLSERNCLVISDETYRTVPTRTIPSKSTGKLPIWFQARDRLHVPLGLPRTVPGYMILRVAVIATSNTVGSRLASTVSLLVDDMLLPNEIGGVGGWCRALLGADGWRR